MTAFLLNAGGEAGVATGNWEERAPIRRMCKISPPFSWPGPSERGDLHLPAGLAQRPAKLR